MTRRDSTVQDQQRTTDRDELAGRAPGAPGRGRDGRRLLAPLAGAAFALALLAGCGGAEEAPAEDPPAESSEDSGDGADEQTSEAPPADEDTTEDADESDDADEGDSADEPEDPEESGDAGEADEADGGTDAAGDENLFEGTWGFGHDTKVLSAEELADLLETEAEARGPAEMSLDVECEDGVDTGTQDYTASCTAFADEGVEHPWAITVGPADAGLEVEVENAD